jgi:rubredoxin
MQAFMCTVCGYLYDTQSADRDVENNVMQFQDLDPEWHCPVCDVRSDLFQPVDSDRVPDVTVSDKTK